MLLQPGSRPVSNCADYVLVRKIGAGAFGEVWHANGPGGFDVALKFIRLSQHGIALELRSLEAVKSIRHPNLVSLFGAWLDESWLILSMELCDCSLQDALAAALDRGLPGVPLPSLLNWMADAANGLDALNAKQVQHRDVKPANLLLLDSGLKVADFGVAKVLEQTVGTNTGAGTLAYTAPECFGGKLAQQSDQYSLAVTYYHLRTGCPLFQGDQAQVMYGHLELEPDLSTLLPEESAILARALAKEPGKRWPNCRVLANGLMTAYEQVAYEACQRREPRSIGATWKPAYDPAREEDRLRQEAEPGRAEEERQEHDAATTNLKHGARRNGWPEEFNYTRTAAICYGIPLLFAVPLAIAMVFSREGKTLASDVLLMVAVVDFVIGGIPMGLAGLWHIFKEDRWCAQNGWTRANLKKARDEQTRIRNEGSRLGVPFRVGRALAACLARFKNEEPIGHSTGR